MSIHYGGEFKITTIACNQVTHQGEFIRALCLNPKCQQSSAICPKCLLQTHIHCSNQVEEIEIIPKQLLELQKLQTDIMVLQENINKPFKQLLSQIEQILMPISQYQDSQNFTNLNGIGFLLRKLPKEAILRSFDLNYSLTIVIVFRYHFQKYKSNQTIQNKTQSQTILMINHKTKWKTQIMTLGSGMEKAKYYMKIVNISKQLIALIWRLKSIKQINHLGIQKVQFTQFLGEVLQKLGRLEESINCFEEALKLDPNWQCAKDSLIEVKLNIQYKN